MAFSKLEKALAAAVGLDILKPGTSRAAATKAAQAIGIGTARAAPVAARGGAAALRTGAALARRNPYAAAGLAGYGAYRAGAFDPIEEAIQMEVDRRIMEPLRDVRDIPENIVRATETPVFRPAAKRKVSKYSKAIKSAMAAVKASKFNGKKGKISNAKTTFAKVNKVASAVNKGKKVSAKGVTGVIKRAVSKYL